jgi:hypothetical protein
MTGGFMDPRKYAMYGGLLMLLMGLISSIPGFVGSSFGLPALQINASYGSFLGAFPMNAVNKAVLILFGAAGMIVANLNTNSLPRSILYSRVVFYTMGLAAILGLFPQTSTFFGYAPLFGGAIVPHAIFAAFGAYFGFTLTHKVQTEIKTNPNLRRTFQSSRS